MQKQYLKIAQELEMRPQGVHLVHYVLQNMKASCVFPPSANEAGGSFFSPLNYDEHMPESSIEILGHSVSGVTYRHYAHRDPLAFKAIMTIPQPSAFMALPRGIEGECPCCRRKFAGE